MGKSDNDVNIQDVQKQLPLVILHGWNGNNHSEYRQFEWVRSTMRVRLAILADEDGIKPGSGKGKNTEV
jgi:hypothetical protein